MDHADAARCINCDTPLHGRYCHVCGEKRLAAGDRTVRAFLAHALEAVTNLESSPTWRSFGTLVARPGKLTDEHVRGRRRPYLGPFKLFLVINVVYFFWVSLTGMSTFTTPLGTYLNDSVFRWFSHPLVAARFGGVEAVPGEFYERFNQSSSRQARSLVMLMIPMLAALVGLIQARRGRLFADHLVFATHFMAFVLVLSVALGGMIYVLDWTMPGIGVVLGRDVVISPILLLLMSAYLAAAFRGAYGDRPGAAVAKGVGLGTIGFFLALTAYRMILFFPVFLTV